MASDDERRVAPPPAAPRTTAGAPLLTIESSGWPRGYALLDSGGRRKLERFGERVLVRPEPQALWTPSLAPADWGRADAWFDTELDDEDRGRWRARDGLAQSWRVPWGELELECRLTPFGHVGLFPEQAPHWLWMRERIAGGARPFRLLNLFAYTGAATLVGAASGAEVTHVDASKKAIAWARDNQKICGLDDRPVRWLCDDAVKFAAREGRRGARYDGIVLDPPKFGRGPDNETFDLFSDLAALLAQCAALLSDDASFLLLTAYAVRLSSLTLREVMHDAAAVRGGEIQFGELVQVQDSGTRRLSTSLFARWTP